MLPFHIHDPLPTGILITAGYRKNNLPPNAYVAITTGQLWVCACKRKFVELEGPRLIELENEGALAQYDRAGSN